MMIWFGTADNVNLASFTLFGPSLRWLQYHDKFTANLPGMLPLAIGVRVALTEHVDRSDDKHLLRGSNGRVHSFVWPENEDRPSVVYVKFDNAQWTLQGVDEPGVYPIIPIKKNWCLDAGKKSAESAKVPASTQSRLRHDRPLEPREDPCSSAARLECGKPR